MSKRNIILIPVNDNLDVNRPDKEGNTPLHLACGNGSLIIVQELLKVEKIELDTRNHDNLTPLEVAVQKGYNEVASLLRRKKQNSAAKSSNVTK